MAAAKGGKGGKRTIKPASGSGQKSITFKPRGLHASLGVPQGQPIPAGKMRAAARGDYGPKAQQQAQFAQNVLGDKAAPAKASGAKAAGNGKTPRTKGTTSGK